MLMPGGTYSAGNGYRYGFNGKENDNEVKGQGGEQDYGMRIYNPRIGKFLSVDPLSKKFPYYTPYQFSGNSPVKFIDLDGLEPADPGKPGQHAVANKIGTDDYYNWTWGRRRGSKYQWIQGSSTSYQNGDVQNISSHDDDTKTYHPEVQVKPLTINQYSPIPLANDNDVSNRLSEFTNTFTAGTKLESSDAQYEAHLLLQSFVTGADKFSTGSHRYTAGSEMAKLLSEDPAFINLAKSFEQKALNYFNSNNGSLEGFNGNEVLAKLGMPYIKDTWFMHTVMGGTQQWNAQIQKISANEIKVQYIAWDRFGAGTDDARSSLPGLPSLYWLQHNSLHYNQSSLNQYKPFVWGITVIRK